MDDKEKEITVEWSDEVKAKADADPKMAEALRNVGALFRQAMQGVVEGKYDSFEDAMEILTGNRPERIDLDSGELIDEDD